MSNYGYQCDACNYVACECVPLTPAEKAIVKTFVDSIPMPFTPAPGTIEADYTTNVDGTKGLSKVRYIWWYQSLPQTRPIMYGTFLTPEEALEMCKGYFAYGKVQPVITAL